MSNKRSIMIVAIPALIAAATVAFWVGTASTEAPVVAQISNNLPLRAAGDIRLAAVEASDYYERHPGMTIAVEGAASDWFERHPGVLNAAKAADLSDYFQRHPTTVTLGEDAGASDYFERHPELFQRGSGTDLSDWFQRHPGSLNP